MTPPDPLFWGVRTGDRGHFLWDASMARSLSDQWMRLTDAVGRSIDGAWGPGVTMHRSGAPWAYPWEQPEGAAAYIRRGGWSGVAWWDRSVDRRRGCNAGIWAEGDWTAGELLAAGADHFPSVFGRFDYEVVVVQHWDEEPAR